MDDSSAYSLAADLLLLFGGIDPQTADKALPNPSHMIPVSLSELRIRMLIC
jgi:hypothetical protein